MVHDHFPTLGRASPRQSETSSSPSGLPGDGGTTDASSCDVRRRRHQPSRHRQKARRLASDGVGLAGGVEKGRSRGAGGCGSGSSETEADRPPARRGRGRAREGPEGKRLWHRSVDTGPGGRGDRGGHRCQLSPRTARAGPSRTARLDPPEAGTPGDRARRRGDRAVGERTVAEGKKNARRRGALIVFQDESGFSLLPSVRSTWAPRGKTPVLRHHFSWKRLSMAGALAYEPDGTDAQLVFQMRPGAYNDESLIEFLTEMHALLEDRLVTLIWDGLPSQPTRVCAESAARPSSALHSSVTRASSCDQKSARYYTKLFNLGLERI